MSGASGRWPRGAGVGPSCCGSSSSSPTPARASSGRSVSGKCDATKGAALAIIDESGQVLTDSGINSIPAVNALTWSVLYSRRGGTAPGSVDSYTPQMQERSSESWHLETAVSKPEHWLEHVPAGRLGTDCAATTEARARPIIALENWR